MYQLIAFDVDGTLIGHAANKVVWEIINEHALGSSQVNKLRYRAYIEGEITYEEWVALDVGDWIMAGVTRAELVALVQKHLFLLPGAPEMLAACRDAGMKLAIISGTIDVVVDVHLPDYPFFEIFTNKLHFDETGRVCDWTATPYDMEGKATALRCVTERLNIDLGQTAYVGDNINDISALSAAGLAIAYEPKAAIVAETADEVVTGDLRHILPLIIDS